MNSISTKIIIRFIFDQPSYLRPSRDSNPRSWLKETRSEYSLQNKSLTHLHSRTLLFRHGHLHFKDNL